MIQLNTLRLSLCWMAVLLPSLSASAQLVRQSPPLLPFPDYLRSTPYVLRNAFGAQTFSQPVAIAFAPGRPDFAYVVEKTGKIYEVDARAGTHPKRLFLDLSPLRPDGFALTTDGECGLLGLAFHPQFATNGTFFVFYSARNNFAQLHQRLARFRTLASDARTADPASHVALFSQFDDSLNHNGGDLHFGPDGYLYVSLGDEGSADDYLDNARWVNRDFHAAILRIDVDRSNVGQPGGSLEPNPHPSIERDSLGLARYSIPPDNPLLSGAAGTLGPIGAGSYPNGGLLAAGALRTEFFAYGLRNPWRFSFDPPTGRLFVGDVGQDAREEIDLVTKGANLGWPYREGTIAGPRANPPVAGSPRVEPIHDYPRSDGYSVTGGLVYRGTALPEWSGDYVFADYSGLVYGLHENSGAWTRRLLARDTPGLVAFAARPGTGELLLANVSTGEILEPVYQAIASALPPTLSATGLFQDIATLTPVAGVVPYSINHPAWNDGASTRRWFAPRNSFSSFSVSNVSQPWTPPNSFVWVQHLEAQTAPDDPAPARRLETRLLLKSGNDTYGISYRWRDDQSDADLVPAEGAEFDYTVKVGGLDETRRWRVPSWNDCRSCHTATSFLRGFDSWQLNRPQTYGSVTDNQVRQLVAAGYVGPAYGAPSIDARLLPAHAALDDETQSLEHRVRSYLAVNCAPCHQGETSVFSVDPALSTAASRLRHAVPQNLGGDPDARILAAGSPEHSMLLRRVLGDGVARMPPLGPRTVDDRFTAALRAYIAALPSDPLYDDWHKAHFDGGNPAEESDTDPDGDGSDNRLEYMARSSPVTPNPDPLALQVSATSDGRLVRFIQPVGRFAAVERWDGFNWYLIPSSGLIFGYPAAPTPREVPVPSSYNSQTVRVRLEER